MARRAKLEVSSINVRISADFARDYSGLFTRAVQIRAAAKVASDKYVAITSYEPSTGFGVISRYSEIDVDGDWFDVDNFGVANPDTLEDVNIPTQLRPNLSTFEFFVEPDMHVMVFESYSASKGLTPPMLQKALRSIFERADLASEFGRIEVDTIKNPDQIKDILNLENLRELKITIRRPNPDDLPDDLAAEIEDVLRREKAEELERTIRSKNDSGLEPSEHTRKLALVAADNGKVEAKARKDGVMGQHSSHAYPLKIADTYNSEETSSTWVFKGLCHRMLDKVRSVRASVRGA